MKLISVVIPAYNVTGYIRKALESLLVQMDDDIEVIVVDDGSTDDTVAVAQAALIGLKPAGYKIIRQPNRGVSAARNAGLNAATGAYVYFLDGDDYVSDELFQTLRPLLTKKTADICCWKFNLVTPDLKMFRRYEQYMRTAMMPEGQVSGREALENMIKRSLYIWTGSAVYKRTFLLENDINFYVDCQRGQDGEFIYYSLLNAAGVRFIDKTLSYYLQRQGSAVHSFSIRRFDAVSATIRISTKLEKSTPPMCVKLDYILRYRRPVEDYLFVAAFAMIQSGIKSQVLNGMVDRQYPGLRSQISGIATKNLRLFDRFRLLYWVYCHAPRVFTFCVRAFSRYQGV